MTLTPIHGGDKIGVVNSQFDFVGLKHIGTTRIMVLTNQQLKGRTLSDLRTNRKKCDCLPVKDKAYSTEFVNKNEMFLTIVSLPDCRVLHPRTKINT